MSAFFVTGTDTGVGKTVVSAAIARAAREVGRSVAYVKPAQTGTAAGDDDAGFVSRSAPGVRTVVPFAFPDPLAPNVAARLAGGAGVNVVRVVEAIAAARATSDLTIVEGAGGLLVRLTEDATMADLAAAAALPLVVVVRPGLGTLNHTALTVEAARARGLEIVGFVVGGFPDDPGLAERTNMAELERVAGVPIAGVVPRYDSIESALPLDADVGAWLAPELGGRFDRQVFLDRIDPRRAHVART